MSILIRGMKTPRNCEYCRFSGIGGLRNERVVCMFTGANAYMNTVQYLDDCPLVEVPPHGRLIDAKALTKDLGNRWNVNDDQDFCNKEVWHGIEDAPTIIEAEEEE